MTFALSATPHWCLLCHAQLRNNPTAQRLPSRKKTNMTYQEEKDDEPAPFLRRDLEVWTLCCLTCGWLLFKLRDLLVDLAGFRIQSLRPRRREPKLE